MGGCVPGDYEIMPAAIVDVTDGQLIGIGGQPRFVVAVCKELGKARGRKEVGKLVRRFGEIRIAISVELDSDRIRNRWPKGLTVSDPEAVA